MKNENESNEFESGQKRDLDIFNAFYEESKVDENILNGHSNFSDITSENTPEAENSYFEVNTSFDYFSQEDVNTSENQKDVDTYFSEVSQDELFGEKQQQSNVLDEIRTINPDLTNSSTLFASQGDTDFFAQSDDETNNSLLSYDNSIANFSETLVAAKDELHEPSSLIDSTVEESSLITEEVVAPIQPELVNEVVAEEEEAESIAEEAVAESVEEVLETTEPSVSEAESEPEVYFTAITEEVVAPIQPELVNEVVAEEEEAESIVEEAVAENVEEVLEAESSVSEAETEPEVYFTAITEEVVASYQPELANEVVAEEEAESIVEEAFAESVEEVLEAESSVNEAEFAPEEDISAITEEVVAPMQPELANEVVAEEEEAESIVEEAFAESVEEVLEAESSVKEAEFAPEEDISAITEEVVAPMQPELANEVVTESVLDQFEPIQNSEENIFNKEDIIYLLNENKTLVFPKFGALTVIDAKLFTIHFIPYLTYNDGVLVDYLASKHQVDRALAADRVVNFIEKLSNDLSNYKTASIAGIGTFTKNEDVITFVQASTKATMESISEAVIHEEVIENSTEIVEEVPGDSMESISDIVYNEEVIENSTEIEEEIPTNSMESISYIVDNEKVIENSTEIVEEVPSVSMESSVANEVNEQITEHTTELEIEGFSTEDTFIPEPISSEKEIFIEDKENITEIKPNRSKSKIVKVITYTAAILLLVLTVVYFTNNRLISTKKTHLEAASLVKSKVKGNKEASHPASNVSNEKTDSSKLIEKPVATSVMEEKSNSNTADLSSKDVKTKKAITPIQNKPKEENSPKINETSSASAKNVAKTKDKTTASTNKTVAKKIEKEDRVEKKNITTANVTVKKNTSSTPIKPVVSQKVVVTKKKTQSAVSYNTVEKVQSNEASKTTYDQQLDVLKIMIESGYYDVIEEDGKVKLKKKQ